MYNQTVNLKSPISFHGLSQSRRRHHHHPFLPLNNLATVCHKRTTTHCYNYSFFNSGGKGIEVSIPKYHPRSHSLRFSNSAVDENRAAAAGGVKQFDVATLGNLCVDVVLSVPNLPPPSLHQRKAYMDQLSKSPPDKVSISSSFLTLLQIFNFIIIMLCYNYEEERNML